MWPIVSENVPNQTQVYYVMDTGTSSETRANNKVNKNSKFGALNGELQSCWREVGCQGTATFHKHGICLQGEDKGEARNTLPEFLQYLHKEIGGKTERTIHAASETSQVKETHTEGERIPEDNQPLIAEPTESVSTEPVAEAPMKIGSSESTAYELGEEEETTLLDNSPLFVPASPNA